MNNKYKISIVIPAFNEENAILDTIKRCKNILKEFNPESEIIIVDDASKDKTYDLIQNTGIRALRHPHNIGYGKSLKDGISIAKNDTIVITDADGTYPIEAIPGMIEIYGKGFDMVVGAREGKHYDESVKKKMLRKLLRFLVEFTTGRKIPDINSGLRVFSKETIIGYFDRLCDTFSFTTSMTLAYMMTSKFVAYTPIKYEPRIGNTKVKLFKDSLRTLQFIIEAIMYYNPFKIFLLVSILLILFALPNFAIAFFTKLKIAYILGISSILLSILNFSLGLLSIQFKQLLKQ